MIVVKKNQAQGAIEYIFYKGAIDDKVKGLVGSDVGINSKGKGRKSVNGAARGTNKGVLGVLGVGRGSSSKEEGKGLGEALEEGKSNKRGLPRRY